jgi:hypothetical protein
MEARMAQRAAEVDTSVPVMHRSQERHSAVLDAPSFFDGAWASELPRERRAIRSRFNRRYSEHRLTMMFGGQHAAELYRVIHLVLSRLIVSEANFIHDDRLDHLAPEGNHAERDAPTIYAVLRHNRRVGETLLGAIRRHAHYVTEERVPTARMDRMRWISELQDNDERPEHFPETDSNGLPLQWDRDYVPRWRLVRQYADELLHGEHLGVCADAPVASWGGRCEDVQGACDDDSGRGYVRYNCDTPEGPTANGFWCDPHVDGCVQDPTVTPDEVVDPDRVVATAE